MEAPLQQRIVGAIVLVTLGVIFIPALLDGSGYRSRNVQDIKIEDKPEFPPLTHSSVNKKTPVQQIREKQQASREADPEQRYKKPIHSFALQVGSFDSNEKAEKLRKQLTDEGYVTYIQKSESRGKASYKVRVGPELNRKVLEKLKAELKKSHKIDGYVVNHP